MVPELKAQIRSNFLSYPTSKVKPTLQKFGGKSKQKNLPTMAAQSDQH